MLKKRAWFLTTMYKILNMVLQSKKQWSKNLKSNLLATLNRNMENTVASKHSHNWNMEITSSGVGISSMNDQFQKQLNKVTYSSSKITFYYHFIICYIHQNTSNSNVNLFHIQKVLLTNLNYFLINVMFDNVFIIRTFWQT